MCVCMTACDEGALTSCFLEAEEDLAVASRLNGPGKSLLLRCCIHTFERACVETAPGCCQARTRFTPLLYNHNTVILTITPTTRTRS